jgi:hypothetical protein
MWATTHSRPPPRSGTPCSSSFHVGAVFPHWNSVKGFFSGLLVRGLLAMTLTDLTLMFTTDEQCRALKKLRWPFGVE